MFLDVSILRLVGMYLTSPGIPARVALLFLAQDGARGTGRRQGHRTAMEFTELGDTKEETLNCKAFPTRGFSLMSHPFTVYCFPGLGAGPMA